MTAAASRSLRTWTYSWTQTGSWGWWAEMAGGRPPCCAFWTAGQARADLPPVLQPALQKAQQGGLEHRGQIRTGLACRRFPCAVRETEVPVSQVLRDISPEAEEWQLVRELSLLGLDEEVLERTFSTLSGGEQTRVLLSALFLDEGSWPMLDEPTDHLDEEGRELLAQYLSHSRRGFLLVSHDRAFLDRCVDHVLALNRTGPELVKGNFSVWYQEKQDRDRREQAQNQQLKGEIRRLEQAARRTSAWSDQVEKTKYASKKFRTAPRPGLCGPQVGQDDEEGQEPGEPAGVCHPGEGGSAPRRGAGRAPEAGPPGRSTVPACWSWTASPSTTETGLCAARSASP